LPGKVVFADHLTQTFEEIQWFPLGMKHFTRAPPHCAWLIAGFYDMSFVFFCNGGKPHMLPLFLPKNVPDEIILMQSLHNNDDAAILLVI
jgi:hypothetical protein